MNWSAEGSTVNYCLRHTKLEIVGDHSSYQSVISTERGDDAGSSKVEVTNVHAERDGSFWYRWISKSLLRPKPPGMPYVCAVGTLVDVNIIILDKSGDWFGGIVISTKAGMGLAIQVQRFIDGDVSFYYPGMVRRHVEYINGQWVW
ncbi:hypothetical protein FRX31_025189 [Thalictrum thalictroides]|uniref:Uncharacterized protein n=1 Tax=Thalictrum thalictroides TaxID=46969 RepID=A0A7J6VM54_THATH|nr:hypothetical protein FRX31_025189 [Thalictrum thalictroides]